MIKVTKHGNHPTYTGTCMRCGCEIICTQEDVMHDMETTNMQMYVFCPECGEKIVITGGYIPTGGATTTTFNT